MSIDWSAPIEAVNANGAVTPAKWHWRDEAGDELGVRFVTCDWFGWPFRDGGQPVHKMDRVWTIRNVTPPMTDLSPETVGKLVALVRRIADVGGSWDHGYSEWKDAKAIVAELPKPVDPDLLIVREIVADGIRGKWPAGEVAQILDGSRDDSPSIQVPLACLKRGRALAAGDRS